MISNSLFLLLRFLLKRRLRSRRRQLQMVMVTVSLPRRWRNSSTSSNNSLE